MSKLFTLKNWLTLAEAQKHLSIIFGEDVSEADILRLCLDRKLTLSVVFVDEVFASLCKPVVEESVEYHEVPSINGQRILKLPIGGQIVYAPSGEMLQCQEEVFSLEDNWPYDLVMMGGERGDIENRYWQLAKGDGVETVNLSGTFVSEGKRFFQLQGVLPKKEGRQRSYYPIGGLPEDIAIVVRPASLLALENSIKEPAADKEKPLQTTERNTLLTIIAALCEYSAIKHQGRGVAKQIEQLTVDIGAHITDETILGVLRKIPNALETRMK